MISLAHFRKEIRRIDADFASVGPARYLKAEQKGDYVRIWDDSKSSIVRVDDLDSALRSVESGAGPQALWVALNEYPEFDRDEVWDVYYE